MILIMYIDFPFELICYISLFSKQMHLAFTVNIFTLKTGVSKLWNVALQEQERGTCFTDLWINLFCQCHSNVFKLISSDKEKLKCS